VGHASRSSGLLRVKVNRDRVFKSGLTTGEDATTGGVRDIITEIA
jgi:hypothetical protein